MSIKKTGFLALLLTICIKFSHPQVNFYSINDIYSISVRETSSICKDSSGFIWSSSKTGILRISEDDYRVYNLPYETANVLNVKLVYCKNQLVAYSNNGQIFKYNSIFDRFELIANISKTTNNNYLSFNQVLIDNNNNLWIASSVGLCKFNMQEGFRREGDSVDINSIEWYNDQQLFVAKTDGLWLFDINKKTFECRTGTSTRIYSRRPLDQKNAIYGWAP
jgi:ligand-binding sensor domain-containing protein